MAVSTEEHDFTLANEEEWDSSLDAAFDQEFEFEISKVNAHLFITQTSCL